MAAAVITSWSDKLIAGFRASPGKSSSVGGLAVILVVLWVRFLFVGHPPASASGAATLNSSFASPALQGPPRAPRGGGDAALLHQWARQPVQPLTRNPFAIPLDCYPRDGSKLDNGSSPNGLLGPCQKVDVLASRSTGAAADPDRQRPDCRRRTQIAIDDHGASPAQWSTERWCMTEITLPASAC